MPGASRIPNPGFGEAQIRGSSHSPDFFWAGLIQKNPDPSPEKSTNNYPYKDSLKNLFSIKIRPSVILIKQNAK